MTTETSIPTTTNNTKEDAGRTFDLLYKPGYAVEMRVFGNNKVVASGYFDSREKFVEWAVRQDATGRDSVYATLNPVDPNLLARQYNVVDRCDGTMDKDVAGFRMLLLDFDPKKKSGIPSTDAEKLAAYDKLLEVRTFLLSLGYPEPVIADSGNGYHLLLRVDLPVDDTKLVRWFLEALNEEFGDDQVGIDTSVHNPARITKVYGTTPRNKGTGTEDRPVRPSKLLDVPAELQTAHRDLLVEVAGDDQKDVRDEPKGYVLRDGNKLDIREFIERHGIEVLKEDEWDGPDQWAGSSKWIVPCPWNDHRDNACHIIQNPEGVISARCKHDSCQGKDWRDFRERFEPGTASKVSRVPVPQYVGTPGTPTVSRLSKKNRPTGGQRFLVADALPENFPTSIFGDSGAMKTMLGEHLILSIAAGKKDWLGHAINRQTDALIIDFELDEATQLRRLYDLAAGMGMRQLPEGLGYIEAAGMRTSDVFAVALDYCERNNVGVVLIDSLGVAMGGDMEGARDVINFNRETIDRFRAIGTTAIIIDHQGKLQMGENYQSKTQYGSAFKKHLVRSQFQIEARDGEADERRVTIRHKKTNFGPLMDPFGARITFGHEKITIEADELSQADLAEEATVNVSKRILIALEDGPMFPNELQESLGVALKSVKNRLTDLKKAGKVRETGLTEGQAHQVELASVPSVPIPIRDGTGDTSPEVRGLYKTLRELYPDWSFSPDRVAEIIGPLLEDHPDPVEAFATAAGSNTSHAWTENAARELLTGGAA